MAAMRRIVDVRLDTGRAFEALTDLYAIATQYGGLSPALYAFADWDGSLSALLDRDAAKPVVATEGLLDGIKTIIANIKHRMAEGGCQLR